MDIKYSECSLIFDSEIIVIWFWKQKVNNSNLILKKKVNCKFTLIHNKGFFSPIEWYKANIMEKRSNIWWNSVILGSNSRKPADLWTKEIYNPTIGAQYSASKIPEKHQRYYTYYILNMGWNKNGNGAHKCHSSISITGAILKIL